MYVLIYFMSLHIFKMKSSEKCRLLTVFLMADNFYLIYTLFFKLMYKFSMTLLLVFGLAILIARYLHGQCIIH